MPVIFFRGVFKSISGLYTHTKKRSKEVIRKKSYEGGPPKDMRAICLSKILLQVKRLLLKIQRGSTWSRKLLRWSSISNRPHGW